MNKLPNWLLILLPGIFFWLGWPPLPLFFLLFLGFVPIFELENRMREKHGWSFFWRLYLALLLWNVLTTWWVWNSTIWGCITMLVCNSLFMCIPWLVYRFAKRKIGDAAVYLFVVLWLLYEFLHHRWDLSWPWLTLGNGLAEAKWLVQWYDITGTLGGSAFILAMNVLLWKAITLRKKFYYFAAPALFIFVCLSSWFNIWKYENFTPQAVGSYNTVVLQPSFDPWNEKFDRDPADLVQEMLDISAKGVDSSSELLVWPETSLVGGVSTSQPERDPLITRLKIFQHTFPKLHILTGADMETVYLNTEKRPSGTARKTANPRIWWDAYNSAVFLNTKGNVAFYHKSKLVPGTEQMPFVDQLPFIDKLAVSLDPNSISGSLGSSDTAIVLGDTDKKIAPVICYESIYGDYVSDYVNNGAKAIAIITNDAWWGNTPGYKQHLAYGALRAIEQRKWIIRSANTGTSCFVDPEGNILQATEWWQKTTIKNKIFFYDKKTLYCRIGDTGILAILASVCLILGALLYRKQHL
jgi:apolipoprotein N-acyltransferase